MNVIIPNDIYAKIQFWMREAAPNEVSGLGMVTVEGETFTVTDVCLLEQENTASTTDMTAEAVGKAIYEFREHSGHLKFWWHSHVNMSAFFSATDTATIKEMGENGWCLATVFNLKGEHTTTFYHKAQGICPAVQFEKVETTMGYLPTSVETKKWKKEFKAKVKEKKWGGILTGKGITQGKEVTATETTSYEEYETLLNGTMVDEDGYVCKLDYYEVMELEDYYHHVMGELPPSYLILDLFYNDVEKTEEYEEWLNAPYGTYL